MKTEKNKNFKIVEIKRANNSTLGNPSYYITVENDNGEYITGRTGSNCSIGYEVCYSWETKTKNLTYHYTKNGNLIFTRVNG